MRTLSTIFVAVIVAVATTPAHAHEEYDLFEYYGEHPVPDPIEGWCEEDESHVHGYELDPEEYGVYEIDGVHYFVGDAVLHDHIGRSYWYYDPHPLGFVDHWCVLDGPHSHWWAPQRHRAYGRWYTVWDDYYYYTGYYDRWYAVSWNTWYAPHWRIHLHRSDRHHRRYGGVSTYRPHPHRSYSDGRHAEPERRVRRADRRDSSRGEGRHTGRRRDASSDRSSAGRSVSRTERYGERPDTTSRSGDEQARGRSYIGSGRREHRRSSGRSTSTERRSKTYGSRSESTRSGSSESYGNRRKSTRSGSSESYGNRRKSTRSGSSESYGNRRESTRSGSSESYGNRRKSTRSGSSESYENRRKSTRRGSSKAYGRSRSKGDRSDTSSRRSGSRSTESSSNRSKSKSSKTEKRNRSSRKRSR